jgi:hypothetical protein
MVFYTGTIVVLMFSCTEEGPVDSSSVHENNRNSEQRTEDDLQCPLIYDPDPFIDHVVSYTEGEGAGFGQDNYPEIIFGAPMGAGPNAGSLDVLSLGMGGEIVIGFDEWSIVDGAGADFIVFENPFTGWVELGEVSASQDGETWYTWDCDTESWEGCAGITPVLSHPDNCIDARDPYTAGGDSFELADVGLDSAKYIRIQDVSGQVGGFDLDAISIVNGVWE